MPTETDMEPNLKDYKLLLSGTLEYMNSSVEMEEFQGILKLNKDPRAELLGKENFIMKMSKIRNTNWVLAIVIYCGKNCKIMRNSDFLRQKENFAYRVTKKFNYFMIFVVILLSMVIIYLSFKSLINFVDKCSRIFGSQNSTSIPQIIRKTRKLNQVLLLFGPICAFCPFIHVFHP